MPRRYGKIQKQRIEKQATQCFQYLVIIRTAHKGNQDRGGADRHEEKITNSFFRHKNNAHHICRFQFIWVDFQFQIFSIKYADNLMHAFAEYLVTANEPSRENL